MSVECRQSMKVPVKGTHSGASNRSGHVITFNILHFLRDHFCEFDKTPPRIFFRIRLYKKKNRSEKVDYHILILGIVKLLSRKTIMILENQRFNNKYLG